MKEIQLLNEKSQISWCDWSNGTYTPRIQWNRYSHKSDRFYFAKPQDTVVTAIGITSVIDKSFGESKFLREWKDARISWKEDLNKMSLYGTMLHAAVGEMAKGQEISDVWFRLADEYFDKKIQFKKDILSIKKWIIDYNVEFIFIEGILAKQFKLPNGYSYICSAIDFFCEIDLVTKVKSEEPDGEYVRGDKKGQVKTKTVTTETKSRVKAIIDLKSNFDQKESKSFFDSHKYQLIFGRDLIAHEFNLPKEDIRMFNISPLGWNKEPKFTLFEHVIGINRQGFSDEWILNNRINTAIAEGQVTPNGLTYTISDKLSLGSVDDIIIQSYEEKAEELLRNRN
jgi:hypothetical protein